MTEIKTMRQLTQVEEHVLLGVGHKDPALKLKLIELYNEGKPKSEQLRPITGRKLHTGTEVLLFREQLPQGLQEALDRFEVKLKAPYVGNILHSG